MVLFGEDLNAVAVTVRREDCQLRPLGEGGRERWLVWRNSEPIRSASLNDGIVAPEEHQRWFRALCDSTEIALVFEHIGNPCGFIRTKGLEHGERRCEWSFYIGEEQVPRGLGSAMGFLFLDILFGEQELDRLLADVIAANDRSRRYHERLGFEVTGSRRARRSADELEVLRFELEAGRFMARKSKLAHEIFAESLKS